MYIVVGVCLLAIIAGLIGLVQALSGNAKAPPAYESRAPAKVAPAASMALIDLDSASRPPISDGEFLLFHRVARTVTPQMATERWQQALRPFVSDERVLRRLRPAVADYLQYVRQRKRSSARDIDVRRPTTILLQRPGRRAERVQRTGATASVLLAGRSLDGTAQPPSRLVVQYTWQRREGGIWRITSVEPLYQPAEDPAGGERPSSLVGG